MRRESELSELKRDCSEKIQALKAVLDSINTTSPLEKETYHDAVNLYKDIVAADYALNDSGSQVTEDRKTLIHMLDKATQILKSMSGKYNDPVARSIDYYQLLQFRRKALTILSQHSKNKQISQVLESIRGKYNDPVARSIDYYQMLQFRREALTIFSQHLKNKQISQDQLKSLEIVDRQKKTVFQKAIDSKLQECAKGFMELRKDVAQLENSPLRDTKLIALKSFEKEKDRLLGLYQKGQFFDGEMPLTFCLEELKGQLSQSNIISSKIKAYHEAKGVLESIISSMPTPKTAEDYAWLGHARALLEKTEHAKENILRLTTDNLDLIQQLAEHLEKANTIILQKVNLSEIERLRRINIEENLLTQRAETQPPKTHPEAYVEKLNSQIEQKKEELDQEIEALRKNIETWSTNKSFDVSGFIDYLEFTLLENLKKAYTNTAFLDTDSMDENDLKSLKKDFDEISRVREETQAILTLLKEPSERDFQARLGQAYIRFDEMNERITAIARKNEERNGLADKVLKTVMQAVVRPADKAKEIKRRKKEAIEAFKNEKFALNTITKEGKETSKKRVQDIDSASSPELIAYKEARERVTAALRALKVPQGGNKQIEALRDTAQKLLEEADKERNKIIELYGKGKIEETEMPITLLTSTLLQTACVLDDPGSPEALKALQKLHKDLPKQKKEMAKWVKALIVIGIIVALVSAFFIVNAATHGAALPFTIALFFQAKAVLLPYLSTQAAWMNLFNSIPSIMQPIGNFATQFWQGFRALPLIQQIGYGLELLASPFVGFYTAKLAHYLVTREHDHGERQSVKQNQDEELEELESNDTESVESDANSNSDFSEYNDELEMYSTDEEWEMDSNDEEWEMDSNDDKHKGQRTTITTVTKDRTVAAKRELENMRKSESQPDEKISDQIQNHKPFSGS